MQDIPGVPSPPTPSLSPRCAVIPERHKLGFGGYSVYGEKLFPPFAPDGWRKERGCSKRITCKEGSREDCHFMPWLDVCFADLSKGKETWEKMVGPGLCMGQGWAVSLYSYHLAW